MKRLLLAIILSVLVTTLCVSSALAATDVEDYPSPPVYADVFVTAIGVDSQLAYVELYNVGSSLADVRDWKLQYDTDSGITCETLIDSYLLPKDYGLVGRATGGPEGPYIAPLLPCEGDGLVELRLVDQKGNVLEALLPDAASGDWRRKGTTVSSRDGATFREDFDKVAADSPVTVFSGGWYLPPAYDARMQIVEVVANPRACSPLESTLDCADYVKLWVAPDVTQDDLAYFAVRSDSGGTKRTSSNGADLASYPITDDGYITVPLSITNSGGHVWIEDTYGTMRYSDAVVAYPDMSADTKRGYAWALDGSWQWTATPRPDGANNIYIPPEPVKSIKTSSSNPAPCREGQERNPATNRCRSIVDAIADLVPCREGQERNPATNRCRNVLAASDSLVPCKEGQERNPETNRCRKITTAAADVPLVQDVPSDSRASRTGWIVAGIVVAGAIAYGIYEWRDDIRRKLLRR